MPYGLVSKCHCTILTPVRLINSVRTKHIYYELKDVQNVLGLLLITILKFRNNCFYKNFYSKTR